MSAFFALFLSLVSAFAGYGLPPAALTIDNTSDGQVQVFVDSHFLGEVRADNRRTFSVLPGYRDVRVQHDLSGYRLFDERAYLSPTRGKQITIKHPRGTLLLGNTSDSPILVKVSAGNSHWIAPGESRSYSAKAGSHDVKTTYWIRGVERLDVRRFRVDPNQTTRGSIGAPPKPAPARISLTNAESMPVSVFIGGRERGTLRPGERRMFEVEPGRTWVMVKEPRGQVLFDRDVNLEPADSEHFVIDAPNRTRVLGVRLSPPSGSLSIARR